MQLFCTVLLCEITQICGTCFMCCKSQSSSGHVVSSIFGFQTCTEHKQNADAAQLRRFISLCSSADYVMMPNPHHLIFPISAFSGGRMFPQLRVLLTGGREGGSFPAVSRAVIGRHPSLANKAQGVAASVRLTSEIRAFIALLAGYMLVCGGFLLC